MNSIDCMNLIVDAYSRLYSMAQEQLKLLSQERLAEFFALSSRVQAVQRQVSNLNKKLLGSERTGVGKPVEQKARDEISRLQGLIEGIYADMEDIIQEKKEVVRQELVKLNKGQKALRGYHRADKTPPRFVQKIT